MTEDDSSGCGEADLLEAMLVYISQTDSYFGSFQRDNQHTDCMTLSDKVKVAHDLLLNSPSQFLCRYGKHLNSSHKRYFLNKYTDDKDLMYQLELLNRDEEGSEARIKNRRFSAMRHLLQDGEYFSDEQMKHRDPLLYEQMVGQYLSEEDIKDQSDALLKQHTGLSTILFEQMESRANDRLYQSQVDTNWSEDEDEDEEDNNDYEGNNVQEHHGNKASETADDVKMALKQEFLHIMQERFLHGEDSEFNYEQVDCNTEYDDLVQESLDAEEKYFNDDDAEEFTDAKTTDLIPKEGNLNQADDYDY